MNPIQRLVTAAVAALVLVSTTGCGTLGTIGKLEDGAAAEAGRSAQTGSFLRLID